jgi:hypothetical protein
VDLQGSHCSCWFWSSFLVQSRKDGGMPSGVLIIVAFIIWHLFGSFDILSNVYCLMPLRKVFIQDFHRFLMILTIWFVESQMVYFDQIENLVLILIFECCF